MYVRILEKSLGSLLLGTHNWLSIIMAIALMHAGVENYLIIERDSVGSSFAAWPDETRFITPSFPSNSIGMLDLNSVAIGFPQPTTCELSTQPDRTLQII